MLANIGPCSIALYTGSTFEQTWLASIAEEIDVSKVATINWAVDPNVGPNGERLMDLYDSEAAWLTSLDRAGNYYFIRYTSKNLKDSTEAAYPHTAYSAKFTYVRRNIVSALLTAPRSDIALRSSPFVLVNLAWRTYPGPLTGLSSPRSMLHRLCHPVVPERLRASTLLRRQPGPLVRVHRRLSVRERTQPVLSGTGGRLPRERW